MAPTTVKQPEERQRMDVDQEAAKLGTAAFGEKEASAPKGPLAEKKEKVTLLSHLDGREGLWRGGRKQLGKRITPVPAGAFGDEGFAEAELEKTRRKDLFDTVRSAEGRAGEQFDEKRETVRSLFAMNSVTVKEPDASSLASVAEVQVDALLAEEQLEK